LLLSALAQHTRNVIADPRASLLVADSAAQASDPPRAARVIVAGRVVRVAEADAPAVRDRYLASHPEARELLALDFRFYQLDPAEVLYVGGLAQAAFLPASVLGEGSG
jgi:putative heme iron utilization protein